MIHQSSLAAPHRLLWLLLCALTALAGFAQTDAQFSQYYEVPSFYNPGAVGTTDSIRLRLGGRMQWVGIEHAPVSILGVADMPVKITSKQRVGVGVVAESESYGLFSSLNIGAQVAYKFRKLGGEWAVGLQIGMYDQKFKGSEVILPDDDDYHQSTDDAIPQRDLHGTALDLAAGVWYRRPRFWAGISCTHLTSPAVTLKSEGTEATSSENNYEFRADRTLYFMAGCNIPLKNSLFVLMPSILAKSNFTFTTGEATFRVCYNKFLMAGIGYRWADAVYLTVGAQFKDFFVGYTYDYSTTAIAKATSGSHEVFLGYALKLDLSDKNKNRHKSVRIM